MGITGENGAPCPSPCPSSGPVCPSPLPNRVCIAWGDPSGGGFPPTTQLPPPQLGLTIASDLPPHPSWPLCREPGWGGSVLALPPHSGLHSKGDPMVGGFPSTAQLGNFSSPTPVPYLAPQSWRAGVGESFPSQQPTSPLTLPMAERLNLVWRQGWGDHSVQLQVGGNWNTEGKSSALWGSPMLYPHLLHPWPS